MLEDRTEPVRHLPTGIPRQVALLQDQVGSCPGLVSSACTTMGCHIQAGTWAFRTCSTDQACSGSLEAVPLEAPLMAQHPTTLAHP